MAESSSAAGASPVWEREGREEDGEEGVPPELAVGPGKMTATAWQDIFASNWFSGHGDLTFLPSHRSTAVSRVPPASSS